MKAGEAINKDEKAAGAEGLATYNSWLIQ